jgi:hypothetical protein
MTRNPNGFIVIVPVNALTENSGVLFLVFNHVEGERTGNQVRRDEVSEAVTE